jgi:hypothetical protein
LSNIKEGVIVKMNSQAYPGKSNQYEVAITNRNLRLAFVLGLSLSRKILLPTVPLRGI